MINFEEENRELAFMTFLSPFDFFSFGRADKVGLVGALILRD